MPASWPLFSDNVSSATTACGDLTSHNGMSSTVSPSPRPSSTNSPYKCEFPQARHFAWLPDPIIEIDLANKSIGSASCFAESSLSTPQRAAAPSTGPIALCTPDAGMPVTVWNPSFLNGTEFSASNGTELLGHSSTSFVYGFISKSLTCYACGSREHMVKLHAKSDTNCAKLPHAARPDHATRVHVRQPWLKRMEAMILQNRASGLKVAMLVKSLLSETCYLASAIVPTVRGTSEYKLLVCHKLASQMLCTSAWAVQGKCCYHLLVSSHHIAFSWYENLLSSSRCCWSIKRIW